MACRREVELNRRLAADVYLGVADVLDEHGRPLDHVVMMRRMPAGQHRVGGGGGAVAVVEGSWRAATDDRIVIDRRLVDERLVRVRAVGGTLVAQRLVEVAVALEVRDPATAAAAPGRPGRPRARAAHGASAVTLMAARRFTW